MWAWKDKLQLKGDKTLWYVIIGLAIASLLVVYSSTGSLAYRVNDGDTSAYLIKQVFLLFLCFIVLLWLQSVHYKYFLGFAFVLLFLSFVCLLWAKLSGTTLNDAGRWVKIPLIGFTFQPSELAKLGVIMYTARSIAFEQTDVGCNNRVLVRMLFVLPVLFMIFMENFSTSALLGGVCLVMLFVGRLPWMTFGKLIGGVVVAVGLLLTIVFVVPEQHLKSVGRLLTIKHRVEHFVNPDVADNDDSYQSDQDAYLCPQGKTLRLNGLYRSASGLFWQYKAEKADCICCPVRGKCLSEHDRRGARKLEDSYFKPSVQRSRNRQSTDEYRQALKKRQIWCEGTFAAQKWGHNLTRVLRRGLEAAEDHCLLSAVALNLKRMIKCLN